MGLKLVEDILMRSSDAEDAECWRTRARVFFVEVTNADTQFHPGLTMGEYSLMQVVHMPIVTAAIRM